MKPKEGKIMLSFFIYLGVGIGVVNMFKRPLIYFVIFLMCGCSNVSPLKEVKNASFGASGIGIGRLVDKHPEIDNDSIRWIQRGAQDGWKVDCKFKLKKYEKYEVFLSFEVFQYSVEMTMADLFNRETGFAYHFDPEKFIVALERKTSIFDTAIGLGDKR